MQLRWPKWTNTIYACIYSFVLWLHEMTYWHAFHHQLLAVINYREAIIAIILPGMVMSDTAEIQWSEPRHRVN